MKAVLLGDSFTAGFGVSKDKCWASLLNTHNIEYINEGINGDTTSGMLARFQTSVINHKPRYALISGGTNDFIAGSSIEIPKNNYMAMVHQAYHNNIVPIIGIEPDMDPSLVRSDWAAFADFHKVREKALELRNWLYHLSSTLNIYLLDFSLYRDSSTPLPPCETLTLDGLHYTEEGHALMSVVANNFFKNLR